MEANRNKQFIGEYVKNVGKDWVSPLFLLNICWWAYDDFKHIYLGDEPMFARRYIEKGKIHYKYYQVYEAPVIRIDNIEELVITNTKLKDRRVVKKKEILNLIRYVDKKPLPKVKIKKTFTRLIDNVKVKQEILYSKNNVECYKFEIKSESKPTDSK